MSEGVEWALHSCLNLSWVGDEAVTARKLAAFYQLPTAYMNKQLQALTRAGILSSTSGPRGGFRLARTIDDITLLDIVVAIEGREDIFRCDQVLRHGPGGSDEVDYRHTCVLSGAMRKADLAWRSSLAQQTIADIRTDVEKAYPHTRDATLNHFLNAG
ncbi:Rrf2 family transcriptional regulator [Aeromicrobium sp.]|uniref:RrF2 family transcriptional regulator n=1 Tax=Aeromicrobium sp. TaxID=1871063 RepID=UPI0030C5D228